MLAAEFDYYSLTHLFASDSSIISNPLLSSSNELIHYVIDYSISILNLFYSMLNEVLTLLMNSLSIHLTHMYLFLFIIFILLLSYSMSISI